MNRFPASLMLTVTSAFAAAVIGASALMAEEKKEEYVPTADIKTLVQKPLPGVQGKVLTVLDVTAAPSWLGERHYHSGPVFVVVKEGVFAVEQDGTPQHTLKAGEVYEEPIGEVMRARNLSDSKPVKLLVIQISDEGEALMYKAD